MEHFLSREEEYCLDCCARRSFRVSRFGCVFSCSCRGKLLDFQHVLQGFVSDLVLGGRNVEFLPCVSGSVATDRFKVVQVELDFINNAALVTFANISSSDAIQILSGLPLSLGEWTQTADGGFRYPIDSVDILLQELKLMTRERGEQLYVNGPTKRCMDVVPSPRTVDKEYLAKLLPKKLFAALHQHQINGILQALSFGGRALFADEMGVGKTLQAIGTVVALRAFPVLIVCPAALRFMWSEEVEKWLMEVVELDDIHVITSSSDFLPAKENPKIVITSFHMASLLATHLQGRRWKCLVVDESHMLHTTVDDCGDARYTSLLCELGKHAKHCLLLSGTPSPTTPFDLYNQIDTLVPGLLGLSRFEFALRYCRIEFTPHFKPRECTRSTELHSLLRTTCMIRRLKTETLIDLPSKQRVLLRVAEHEMCLDVAKPPFQKTYAENWMKKNDKIGGVVDFLLSKHNKLVLFAHHIALLDMLTKHVSEKGVSCIRVDGNTPTHSRAEILSMFNSGETRVAIMGITACGVGIQLTGASCALFAELPPDVTWMQQAEDRLHRPGQKKNVTFFYVIGSGSLFDSAHFNRLSSSFQAVRQVTDGVSSSLSASYSTSIISVQETLLEEERNLHASLHGRGALYEISDTATQFLFRISSNTGRIHVSSGDAHLLSLSPYEVRCYWTQKDNFSSQLRDAKGSGEGVRDSARAIASR
uniref:Putative putative SNF2 DNA repair protein n=1 Tax=Trypanosoma vivax (strain Y486) TaxID=1055687 RepID=G0UBS6_TRYVY|nr:putative putative SNF2 DNA repair protein [Trypanosoma vivax Y486]